MTGKQQFADEMVRPAEIKDYSDSHSGIYLEVPIKRDLVEALGWSPGEDTVYFRVRPELEGEDEDEDDEVDGSSEDSEEGEEDDVIVVLELVPSDEDLGRDWYKLKQKEGGFRVTIPSAWESSNEEYEGYENPFHGLERNDPVIVVGYPGKDCIRVYDPDDYRKKTGLDVKAPSLAFLTSSLFNRFTDIAGQTPYSGQKWEIVPFDAQHEVFGEEADRRNYRSLLGFRGDLSLFERVYEKDCIPVVRAREIRVRWNPYYEHPVNEFSGEPVRSKPVKEEIEAGAFIVYKDYLTRSSKVVLPEKGAYIVEAKVKEGLGWVAAAYFGGSTGWDSQYWIEADDLNQMYIPTPTVFKKGQEPENANDWKNGASGP